ncbi:hypothetical protein PENTCL1PPCAC_13627, partial [Pristionchus entomophagus]
MMDLRPAPFPLPFRPLLVARLLHTWRSKIANARVLLSDHLRTAEVAVDQLQRLVIVRGSHRLASRILEKPMRCCRLRTLLGRIVSQRLAVPLVHDDCCYCSDEKSSQSRPEERKRRE